MDYASDLRGLARLLADREITVAQFEEAYAVLNGEVRIEPEPRYIRPPSPAHGLSGFWRGALMVLGAIVIVVIAFIGIGAYLSLTGIEDFGHKLEQKFSDLSSDLDNDKLPTD